MIDARTGSVVARVAGVETRGLRIDANPFKSIRVIEDDDALREFAAGLIVYSPGFTGYGHGPPAPGQMFLSGGEGYGGLGTDLLFLGVPPLEGESADELFARWESTGTIDIVLTPDLDLAYQHPMIDAILAGDIIFRNVPLQRPEGDRLPTPNKRQWVTGEPLQSPDAP